VRRIERNATQVLGVGEVAALVKKPSCGRHRLLHPGLQAGQEDPHPSLLFFKSSCKSAPPYAGHVLVVSGALDLPQANLPDGFRIWVSIREPFRI